MSMLPEATGQPILATVINSIPEAFIRSIFNGFTALIVSHAQPIVQQPWLTWAQAFQYGMTCGVVAVCIVMGLLMLMPLMRNTGYAFSMSQVLLLTYSGLRGAVGLCLALAVKLDTKLTEKL